MFNKTLFLKDEAAQFNLAAIIANYTTAGSVIYLEGDLGTGKTTFVKGFLAELGYTGNVKSPTYTLVEPYEINQQSIYHFDLYRLGSPDELEYAGGRDYFDNKSICLIEWPEKAQDYLPQAGLIVQLSYQQQNGVQGRNCTISSNLPEYNDMIADLIKLEV